MVVNKPEEIHQRFAEAFSAGDITALLALYEADATLIPSPGQTVSGIDAIRAGLQQYLALKGSITMQTTFCIESGDTALLRGKWQLNGKGPDGSPIEMRGNSIEIVRRQSDGSWRFVIDHPFGAD